MIFCPLCGEPVNWYLDADGKKRWTAQHKSTCSLYDKTPPSNSRVYLGDCIQGMAALPDECVDLIVSDPPYLIQYRSKRRHDKTHEFCSPIQNDDNPLLIENYLAACYRVLKQDAAFYVFCSAKTVDFFKSAAQDVHFSLRNTIVWKKNAWTTGDLQAAFGFQYEVILLLNKGRAMLQGKRTGDVWEFPRVSGKAQLHQNQKPVELIERCIIYHSKPGDLVLDGFMGSGTTAIAARNTRRRFLGWEIEPKYFDIIESRLKEGISENP